MSAKNQTIGIHVIGGRHIKIKDNSISGADEGIRLDGSLDCEVSGNYVDAINTEVLGLIDTLSMIGDQTLNPKSGLRYQEEIIQILESTKTSNKKSFIESMETTISLFNGWSEAQPKLQAIAVNMIDTIRNILASFSI